jgi:cysteine-S-conjugate beta-lyase
VSVADTSDFEAISIDALRTRKSEKWSRYPPDVLPAFIAEMDFALAAPIKRALEAAVAADDCGYAYPSDLGTSFAGFAAAQFEWIVDPDRVFAAPDVMAAIAQILRLYTDVGESVVINPPVYPPFFEVIPATGRKIVEAPLVRAEGGKWVLDFGALERAFAEGARAYVLCSPHNPLGRVWTADELRTIVALAGRHDVVVIADEIHAPLAMQGAAHTPYLSIAGENDRAFAALSATKAWNISGLKCALAVAGSRAAADVLSRHWKEQPTETTWRVGHLGLEASIAAFREGRPWLDSLCAHLARNRLLLEGLLDRHLPRAHYITPDAGYLAWIDCSALGVGDDPAAFFLERGRVALSNGRDFGKEGAAFVRLNMGTSSTILTQIVRRMAFALQLTNSR